MAAEIRARRSALPVLGLVTLLVGCGDAGPQSGPGRVEAQVVSPHGAEGSAVVTVFGGGIRGVSAVAGRVFSDQVGDTVRVVVVSDVPGDLRFALSMSDTTAVLRGEVLQVADGDDRLRPTTADYALEFVR